MRLNLVAINLFSGLIPLAMNNFDGVVYIKKATSIIVFVADFEYKQFSV